MRRREQLEQRDREFVRQRGFPGTGMKAKMKRMGHHLGILYRDEINSLQIQLSRTQAGPGRAVKEQQEQNSPNHVQRINLISV